MDHPEERALKTKEDFDDFFYRSPYFAFLDVLGYSNLVRNNTHDALVKLYQDLFTAQMNHVEQNLQDLIATRAEKLPKRYTDPGIRIVNFSDSIMIWTVHGQPSALREIILAVSSLLSLSISQGLPLRGAITRQPFSVLERNNLLSVVGMGLVDAYSMEKTQQWSGCIISPEIVNYFESMEKVLGRRTPSPMRQSALVVEYDIPFVDKDGKPYRKRGHAIDWSSPLFSDDIIRASFDLHGKKDDRPGSDTPQKVQNTVDFHNFCLERTATQKAATEAFIKSLDKQDPASE